MRNCRKSRFVIIAIMCALIAFDSGIFGQTPTASPQGVAIPPGTSAGDVFDNPGRYSPRDLYRMAHEAYSNGENDDARLYAMRVFFDGHRSTNLLNLLGAIELKSKRNLLAAEWFYKSLSVDFNNPVARKTLVRLPVRTAPIPVDPGEIHEHFAGITQTIPRLLENISSPKIHFDGVLKELARGQLYKALALAEEYEKKYPGVDGLSLTALCAWYLGRCKDAAGLLEKGLKLDPHHSILLFVQAQLTDTHPFSSAPSHLHALYEQDKWQEALDSSAKFNQTYPKSSDALTVKARIALELMKTQEAQGFLAEAANRDPGNPIVELLFAQSFAQEGRPQEMEDHLRKALRQGYHLPSINLMVSTMLIDGGKNQDAIAILDESLNYMPFSEREAYPMAVLSAIRLGLLPKARSILDEWKTRMQLNSRICYFEGIYAFAVGSNENAIGWIRRGMQLNPNRLSLLKIIAGYPGLNTDPELATLIRSKVGEIAPVQQQPQMVEPVPAEPPPVPDQVQQPVQMHPAGTVFHIQIAADLEHLYRNELTQLLDELYARLSPLIGQINDPIPVNLISAAGMGSTVAMFDIANNGLIMTSLYFDPDSLKVFLNLEKPWLSEDECARLAFYYPKHQLTRELARIMTLRNIQGASENYLKTAWIHNGLAELLAGSEDVLRVKLLSAHKHLTDKKAQLMNTENLNKIFAEGYSAPESYDMAQAQAYLMTAHLIKRNGNFQEGVKQLMELALEIIKGLSMDDALKMLYGISQSGFDSEWREAAYWALRQGIPYEW